MTVAKVIITPNFAQHGYHCDSIDLYTYYPDPTYDESKATEHEFKTSGSNPFRTYLIDPISVKYLQTMSNSVLVALQSAYFIVSPEYPAVVGDLNPVEQDESKYIFGKLYREIDENYIKNSVFVINSEYNISLIINANEILLYRNSRYNSPTTQNFGTSVHKSRVDFSTYDTFINSLNKICKMIKVGELDNAHVWNIHRAIRHICLRNDFYRIEEAYQEIISKGFHRR